MVSLLHPKVLRYFSAVAQLGSVQAAAREVSISASAIDRQILRLEEHLGVPLFERLPRGMRLTAAGEMLIALNQRYAAELNRTLSDLKHLEGVAHGQVRLAAMDSHANGLLPVFIERLAGLHPGITLDVEIVSPDEAVAGLIESRVDIAVAFNVKPARELHLLWSTELPLGCVVAAGHPLAKSESVTLREVAAWPLAVQSRSLSIRRYLERKHAWLLQQSVPPLTSNSLQLLKSLVARGRHVALTSELDAAPEILAGSVRFIPVRDRNIQPQTLAVAINANRPLPRIARTVTDLLVEHVGEYLAAVRGQAEVKAKRPVRRKRSAVAA